jgi:hypothetical protein
MQLASSSKNEKDEENGINLLLISFEDQTN